MTKKPILAEEAEAKEVTALDKIKELGLEDKLPVEVEFNEEEDPVREKLNCAIDLQDDATRVMLAELEKKGTKIATKLKARIDKPDELIKALKNEQKSGNEYSACFVALDNDDICSDKNTYTQTLIAVTNATGVPMIPYFEGCDKEEIEKRSQSLR